MFDPKTNNDGEYEIRNEKNLEELYNEPSMPTLNEPEHKWRSVGLIGQITTCKQNTKRFRGPSRQKWAVRIKEDLRLLGVTNADEVAKDWEEWRQFVVTMTLKYI